MLFIDGNYENFDKLSRFPVETWCGGKVHKIRETVIHLMRGEVYCIEGNTVFVMGGGYSIDKYRRAEGVSWWPQEMPSEEEYHSALVNLDKVGNNIDYIITHTAPSETVYYLSTLRSLGVKNDVVQEQSLTSFLDEIRRKVTYKHWYFGHFHVDLESIWNSGEIKQRYSVVFESWRLGVSFGSGSHIRAENGVYKIRYDTNI